MTQNKKNEQPAGRQLMITRVFDAPRDMVFSMWTEAQHLKNWWGPAGFEIHIKQLEVKAGGMFHYNISNNGMEMWGRFVYLQITPPEQLVFISSFSDENGNITPSPFMPGWPLEVFNTVTFEEHDGRTTLTIKAKPHNAGEKEQAAFELTIPSMEQGFGGTFDKLRDYLSSLN